MSDPVQKAHERALSDISFIQKRLQEKASLPVARTLLQVSQERLEEKDLEKDAPKTGYEDLDQIIKGFVPGHVYTLTGNTNVGKTSLACNFSVRVANQGKQVLYFALEPENTVVDYIASVRLDKRFDELTPEDLNWDGNIKIYGKQSVHRVEDLVRIVELSERFDLVVIDHVGYFIHSNTNWIQEQSGAVKQLAGLAKKKRCAILLIAHLRKRAPNQRQDYVPTSDDISGSGAFKQDATEVMIVVRGSYEAFDGGVKLESKGKLYVTKTKCGPNGAIDLCFSERKANITSASW